MGDTRYVQLIRMLARQTSLLFLARPLAFLAPPLGPTNVSFVHYVCDHKLHPAQISRTLTGVNLGVPLCLLHRPALNGWSCREAYTPLQVSSTTASTFRLSICQTNHQRHDKSGSLFPGLKLTRACELIGRR